MMAVMPILTKDTALFVCVEDYSGEKVCVVTDENNPSAYFLLAFYQYPYVIAVYVYTGLWTNASGISAKVCALYGDFYDNDNMCCWEKHNWILFVDVLYLFCTSLAFAVFFYQTVCFCEGSGGKFVLHVLSMCSVLIIVLSIGVVYGRVMESNAGGDPGFRLERMKKFLFTFEICTTGVLYIGTYGIVGLLFLVIPVLGYVEAFGLFEFSSDKFCSVC